MIPKKEFYFVRHGQTDSNIGIWRDGHEDAPLNETGRSQAQSIESIIASLPIKTVCYSPLKRAVETKTLITPRLNADQCEIMNLKECQREEWKKIREMGFIDHEKDPNLVKPFFHSVRAGINEALSMEGPILVVAHGGVHWALCCLMHLDHGWLIDNCAPVHYTFQNGQWTRQKL